MEYKVRKESEGLLEKVFRRNERRGRVRSYQITGMLKTLCPEIEFNNDELREVLKEYDEDDFGTFDEEGFTRIALHFLVRSRRQDSDPFSHKHLIGLTDFPLN